MILDPFIEHMNIYNKAIIKLVNLMFQKKVVVVIIVTVVAVAVAKVIRDVLAIVVNVKQ